MNREDMIRYGDLLEQRLIQQHRLNKIETFYVFNGQEGDINDRLDEVLDLRDEAATEENNEFDFELPDQDWAEVSPFWNGSGQKREKFELWDL